MRITLRFSQERINYPAAANMLAGETAVVEDVGIVAPGVLKCVGQNRHRGEVAGVVHLLDKRDNGRCEPQRVKGDAAKWIADDVAQNRALCLLFGSECLLVLW